MLLAQMDFTNSELSDFQKLNKVGEGSYGSVYKIKHV